MSKSRVLVDVSDTEMNVANKPVWICYSKKRTKNICDFKKLIIEKFNLTKHNFDLVLNGGILLENEGTGIFQQGDIIKLQYEENKFFGNQTVDLNSKVPLKLNNYEDKFGQQPNPYLLHSSSYAGTDLSNKKNKYEENEFVHQPNPYLLHSSSYAGTYISNKENKHEENKSTQQADPYLLPSSYYAGTRSSDKVNNYEDNKFVEQANPFVLPSSSYSGTYLPEKINKQEENQYPYSSSIIKPYPTSTYLRSKINKQEENKYPYSSSIIKPYPTYLPSKISNYENENFVQPQNPYLLPSCSYATTRLPDMVEIPDEKQTRQTEKLEAIEAIKNTLLPAQEEYGTKFDSPKDKLKEDVYREDEKRIAQAKKRITRTGKPITGAGELESIEEIKKMLLLAQDEYEAKFKSKDKLTEDKNNYEENNLNYQPTPSPHFNYASTYSADLKNNYEENNLNYQPTPYSLQCNYVSSYSADLRSILVKHPVTKPKNVECIDLTGSSETPSTSQYQTPSTSRYQAPSISQHQAPSTSTLSLRNLLLKELPVHNRSLDLTVRPRLTPSTSASNYISVIKYSLVEKSNANIISEIKDKYVPFMKELISFLDNKKIGNNVLNMSTPYRLSKIKTIYAAFTSSDEQTQIEVFKANKRAIEDWYSTAKVLKSEEKASVEKTKIYNDLIELSNVALVLNSETFECPVCFTEIAPGEGAVLKDCLHSFCKECLRGAIKHSITVEVQCPFTNEEYTCDSHLLEQEIKSLVTKEVYDSHLQRSMAHAESQASNSFHCKTPDCPGWCLVEGEVNTFFCHLCSRTNCLTCAAIHTGQNCQEYQDYVLLSSDANEEAKITRQKLQDIVKSGEAMHCPKCQVIIMKKEGCDFLRCSMCRTGICWVTKGPRWGPGGDGDISGGCKCKLNGEKCHPKCGYCH